MGNLKRSSFGFTLAELLIALAILGVIATFTIPKVLQGQQDSRFRSIAKETAASVSAAYQHYRLNNPVTAGTAMADLTPFLNYVQRDTTNAPVDHKRTFSGAPCNNVHCLRLHNGAVLWYDHAGGYATMGGTATTNCVIFLVDPDGKYSGTTNGPGKAVEFALYSDGALRTRGTMRENSYISAGASGGPEPTHDPDWFGWD